MGYIRIEISDGALSIGAGTLVGAQNGLNITRVPNVVEIGGNLLIDTTVSGVGGGKNNNFIWDLLGNWFLRDVQTQIFMSLEQQTTGFESGFFESITRQQGIRRYSHGTAGTDTRVQENVNYGTGIPGDQGWAINILDFTGVINRASLQVEKKGITFANANNPVNNQPTYIFEGIPEYVNDAAADADANLPSQALYKLTGDRTIYQKP